jgi:hypothetical protein
MKLLLWAALVCSLTAADRPGQKPAPGRDGWTALFNGKDLTGWQPVGNGVWHVMRDGALLGQRDFQLGFFENWPITAQQFRGWKDVQAWLYTTRDFGQFDLYLEYWLRFKGNSGISIRDSSRAKWGIINPPDYTRTPSKIGYEIQLANLYPDPNPSGSIYTFVKAKQGAQIDNEWNSMLIASRDSLIRVSINGQVVAEHTGDPARPKTGPIGLQLHDQFSVVMFRNILIRENRLN